jgi:hypothetical protein
MRLTPVNTTHTSSTPAFLLCTSNWYNGYVLVMTNIPAALLLWIVRLGLYYIETLFVWPVYICVAACSRPNNAVLLQYFTIFEIKS